jgi:hypothetical protein
MATIEIPDVCEFTVGSDMVRLITQTNGDSVTIKGINLDSANAAALAHLINRTENHNLKIEIKEIS